ncbi:farnesyl pyrophosphate synthase-like protein, partial [Leptotrombidium deliense]
SMIEIIINTSFSFVNTVLERFGLKKIYENKITDCEQQLASYEHPKTFESFFATVRDDMNSYDDPKLKKVLKRIDEILIYTVPSGENFRAILTVQTFKNMVNEVSINDKLLKQCYALSWFEEITQAASLVYHDMMKKSDTRNGKRCLHLR